MANAQISPGNAHPPSPLCPPHLRPRLPYRYWTLKIIAFSSGAAASYAVSVRRARVLPAASFRFHLAMDTLAVRLTLPPVGCAEDFHLQVGAPCRAHNEKSRFPAKENGRTSVTMFFRFPTLELSRSGSKGIISGSCEPPPTSVVVLSRFQTQGQRRDLSRCGPCYLVAQGDYFFAQRVLARQIPQGLVQKSQCLGFLASSGQGQRPGALEKHVTGLDL